MGGEGETDLKKAHPILKHQAQQAKNGHERGTRIYILILGATPAVARCFPPLVFDSGSFGLGETGGGRIGGARVGLWETVA